MSGRRDERRSSAGRRASSEDRNHLRAHLLTATLTVAVVIGGAIALYDGSETHHPTRASLSTSGPDPEPEPPPTQPPVVAPYEPSAAETVPNGKRFAAAVAQAALTYPRGSTPRQQAKSLQRFGASVPSSVIKPAFDPAARSWARVVYPQFSGYTGDTMGAMVVTEQTVEGEDRSRRKETRVVDVRLRLEGEEWVLEELASVGGSPPSEPKLSKLARRVLDHPRIELPDSARWDIERGDVDDALLAALAEAADRDRLAVAVLITGHPYNVWATERPSAHSAGLAADIFAVDGRQVIRQRQEGTLAYDLAASFLAGGAVQVGSPWVLPPGGARSFSDDVHQDHLHLQQASS